MPEASVSNVEMYRIWKAQEDLDVGWLLNRLTSKEQTEKMKAGTAFHAAMEAAGDSEHYSLHAMGYSFSILCDCEISMPKMRECSVNKMYGGLLVKGRVDAIDGKIVYDIKTTEQVDLDRYMESLQWRFYLDMTEANRFDWHIFQMREVDNKYNEDARLCEVFGYHKLTQYRYDGLHEDCLKAAQEYEDFSRSFLEKEMA